MFPYWLCLVMCFKVNKIIFLLPLPAGDAVLKIVKNIPEPLKM